MRGNTLCIMVLQILGGLPQKVILSIAVGFLPFVRLFLSLNFVVLSVSNFFYVCLFSSCFFTTAMMIMSLDRGGGLSDRGQTDGRTVHCGSLILILMHPPIIKDSALWDAGAYTEANQPPIKKGICFVRTASAIHTLKNVSEM